MKFNIFKRKPDGTYEEVEFDYDQPEENGFKMPMAHCDQTILHAPGACDYCDHYPEAQALREWWRINFTGETDPGKAPCPSEHFRSAELRDRWPGNTPEGYP
jgi:hypothetical protein